MTTEDLKSWIDETMKNEGVENYKLNISGSGIKGDGYTGEITFVSVETSANGLKKSYDFVIKAAKQSDKLREQVPIKATYLREILIFSKIFPVFEQFELENSVEKPFKKYAKCYHVCEDLKKETLVLENLKVKGFELHNRKVTMSLEHVQFVLEQYARFHAVSMAMKRLKPELFKTLTKDIDDNFTPFVVQTNLVPGFIKYMKKSVKLLNTSQARKFEGYELEIEEIFTRTTYDPEDPVTVILHGDCWNNNFMFKYNQNNKTRPIDVRFLDFQLSRVAHPILDLSNFLYACCDKKILKNFDGLLKLYHATLSDSLSQYGVDVNTFFSLTKLNDDWKTLGKFGLYLATLVIQFALCDSTEAIDLEEAAEIEQEFGESVVTMMRDDERYDERVKAVLEHFAEKFL